VQTEEGPLMVAVGKAVRLKVKDAEVKEQFVEPSVTVTA
jgi:hypothetical protein